MASSSSRVLFSLVAHLYSGVLHLAGSKTSDLITETVCFLYQGPVAKRRELTHEGTDDLGQLRWTDCRFVLNVLLAYLAPPCAPSCPQPLCVCVWRGSVCLTDWLSVCLSSLSPLSLSLSLSLPSPLLPPSPLSLPLPHFSHFSYHSLPPSPLSSPSPSPLSLTPPSPSPFHHSYHLDGPYTRTHAHIHNTHYSETGLLF